jgi:hypothetical protein
LRTLCSPATWSETSTESTPVLFRFDVATKSKPPRRFVFTSRASTHEGALIVISFCMP